MSDAAEANEYSPAARLYDLLLGVGQYPPAITRAEILEMGQSCTIRQLNELIRDLSGVAAKQRAESQYFYKIAEHLSDEVRRRAENLETQRNIVPD